jgi:hypothetical protein
MPRNPNWRIEIPSRLIGKEEWPRIVRIEAASNIMPCWTEEDFLKFNQGRKSYTKPVFLRSKITNSLVIAPKGGKALLAGYLSFSTENEFLKINTGKNGGLLLIHKLVVNPICWRSGVGTGILEYAVSRLRLNMRQMIIPVSVYNLEGADFLKYCRLGCKDLNSPDYNPRGIRCLWEEPDFYGRGHNAYIFGFERIFEKQETTVISTNEI